MSGNKVAPAAFVATSVLTLVLWRIDGELTGGMGESSLYLQLAFSRARFENILASWRPGGLDHFIGTLWINFLYAVAYAVLLASAPLYFSKSRGRSEPASMTALDKLVFMLPFCAGACDWIVHALYIAYFTGLLTGGAVIGAISSAAVLKWLLIATCAVVLIKSYFAVRKNMKR